MAEENTVLDEVVEEKAAPKAPKSAAKLEEEGWRATPRRSSR